jgi:hypothetical protein
MRSNTEPAVIPYQQDVSAAQKSAAASKPKAAVSVGSRRYGPQNSLGRDYPQDFDADMTMPLRSPMFLTVVPTAAKLAVSRFRMAALHWPASSAALFATRYTPSHCGLSRLKSFLLVERRTRTNVNHSHEVACTSAHERAKQTARQNRPRGRRRAPLHRRRAALSAGLTSSPVSRGRGGGGAAAGGQLQHDRRHAGMPPRLCGCGGGRAREAGRVMVVVGNQVIA